MAADWFDDNAPDAGGGLVSAGGSATFNERAGGARVPPSSYVAPGASIAPTGPFDIRQAGQVALDYARSLGPPSDENLAKVAAYMRSLGYDADAKPGSDGISLNGYGLDMVSGYKGGDPSKMGWQVIADYYQGKPLGYDAFSGQPTGGGAGGQSGPYPLVGANLLSPWTTPFKAPTAEQAAQSPGWQFRISEATKALDRAAANKGSLLSGGHLKDIAAFSQDYASNEYDKVYQRALGEYRDAYDIFRNNAGDQYTKLRDYAGLGANMANAYGQQAGSMYAGIGNAQAGGTVGSGNAWGDIIAGVGNAAGTAAAKYYAGKAPAALAGSPAANPYSVPGYTPGQPSPGIYGQIRF